MLSKFRREKLGIKRVFKPKKRPKFPDSNFEDELFFLEHGSRAQGCPPRPEWKAIRRDIKKNFGRVFNTDDSRKQTRFEYNSEYAYSKFFLESGPQHCGVVIPTEGRPEMLEKCLDTIEDKAILRLPVIIVDDGSAERVESFDFIRKRKKRFSFPIVVKRFEERKGPGAARKFGQAYWHNRGRHYVIQMDDDAFIHNHCFENLYANALINDNYGIIGAIGSFRAFYQGNWREEFSINAIGVCYIINKWAIDICGNFDSRFLARQDVDLAVRFWLNGFRVCVLPKADVNHVRYRTKKETDEHRKEMFEQWKRRAGFLLGKKYKKFGLKVSSNGNPSYMKEFELRGYVRSEWRKTKAGRKAAGLD